MGSYEEMVVDHAVEAAWLQLRVRIADRLAEMDDEDELLLEVRPAGADAPMQVRLCAVDAESVEARFIGLVSPSRRLRIRRSTWARLRSLGVVPSEGNRLTVERTNVDHVAYAIYAFFHEELAIVHPSFVDVVLGDLVLVDPPQDIVAPLPKPALPESVLVSSYEDLVGWVDRTLAQRFGHAPHKREDGTIGVHRGDHRLTVGVSHSSPVVEVFAVVAEGVDRKRARKQICRLSATFSFFRFFLRGDRLYIATTVSATPFAPQHLCDAMDMTFHFLRRRGPKIVAKVAPRDAGVSGSSERRAA